VRFIEDKAKVTVDATSVSPSNALSLITADLVAAKNVGITAHARETADVLSILKGVDLTTNDPLASVTDLTVNGKLTARNATGAAGGLKIVVGENAEADFGTTAAKLISVIKGGATASDPGSSVALGGSLTVGDVITIADITVSGGSMFAVGNVNTITKLTLQGAATLAIGTVVNIPNAGIIVPAGATINGFKYKAQDTITAVAEFQTPSATGDREIGSGETLTVTGSTSLSGTDNKVEGTIEVPVGGALSVPENGKVTVDGDIKVDGTFLVEGEIVNNGTIEVSGTYTLDPDATYSGTGTIVVAEGGTVEVKHVSRLSAEDEAALIAEGKAAPTYTFGGLTGTVEIAEGGTLQVNAGREGDGDEEIRTLVGPAVEGDDTPAPFFQLDAAAPAAEGNPAVAAGTVTLDATTNTITVKGNVTLNSPEYGNQPRTMNIQSGEKVVIAAGATLTLEGSLNTYGTGTIDIGEGGKLVIKNEKHLIITAAKLNAIGKGRIVVQGQGNIWRAFEKTGDIPNKSLISVPGSTEDASVGLSRYTWKSCAGETNLFVVDLATKTITPSDKSELAKGEGDKDKVTLAELGFSNAWKEAVPSTAD
jgi:hypothetical protein